MKSARVLFVDDDGSTAEVTAKPDGGRWRTSEPLPDGVAAVVGEGCVRDAHGNFNGQASDPARGGADPPHGAKSACHGRH